MSPRSPFTKTDSPPPEEPIQFHNWFVWVEQRRSLVTSRLPCDLSNGEFIVVWEGPDDDGYGIYARRFSAVAVGQGAEFQVNTFTSNDQQSPAVTSLKDGGYVIVWQSRGQDGDSDGIFARRYDASGVAQDKSEFQVNSYTIGAQANPAIVGLSDGGFVVTWDSNNNQDGGEDGTGIYAKRFDANGLTLGTEFRVNTNTNTTTDNQLVNPAISALHDGSYVITWQRSNGSQLADIYAQIFHGITVQTPTLNQQPLTILQSEKLVFRNSILNASDNYVDNSTLLFEVSAIDNCQFELISQPGIAIAYFIQQQVIVGDVQLIHDGSIQAPSYLMSVSNGYLSTTPQRATIHFNIHSNSNKNSIRNSAIIGGVIGGTALTCCIGLVVIVGLTIIVTKMKRKSGEDLEKDNIEKIIDVTVHY